MAVVASIIVSLVALLHLYFLVLEMFLLDKPPGLGAAPIRLRLLRLLLRRLLLLRGSGGRPAARHHEVDERAHARRQQLAMRVDQAHGP